MFYTDSQRWIIEFDMNRRKARPMSIAIYQWTMGFVLLLIVIGFFALVRQLLNYSEAI